MSNVARFAPPPANGKTFCVDRLVPEGRKRRSWAVIVREADGSETYHCCRTEKYAVWLMVTLREAEAKRQKELEAMARHELGRRIMSMDVEERDLLRRILIREAWLRGVTD